MGNKRCYGTLIEIRFAIGYAKTFFCIFSANGYIRRSWTMDETECQAFMNSLVVHKFRKGQMTKGH